MPNARTLACLFFSVLLTGCAATVERSGPGDLSINASSKQNLAVEFDGSAKVLAHEDWPLLQKTWSESLKREAASEGYNLLVVDRAPAPRPGILLKVDVSTFRYISSGARYAAGAMTGNAWVNSTIIFVDTQTGQQIGSNVYNTKSTAWQGVFSAMTEKQLDALSKRIIADIKAAK
ncbi:DUF4410 domain-containing protein [Pseudomonas sp. CDFA 602]|uniref:hypothetical protein n=1 Tax=Pseudomonas californiensis TaxID=2829823 RepID=UPI001E54DA82|nr:hypothetical protein [Pseudomonas californiensis]MCD5994209.1 DUF4410 domain-containing protein [Pseudomonas californiensis]MCD5999692.1 DUF4410 domain-containing protein [Pseudomonas californiensis]